MSPWSTQHLPRQAGVHQPWVQAQLCAAFLLWALPCSPPNAHAMHFLSSSSFHGSQGLLNSVGLLSPGSQSSSVYPHCLLYSFPTLLLVPWTPCRSCGHCGALFAHQEGRARFFSLSGVWAGPNLSPLLFLNSLLCLTSSLPESILCLAGVHTPLQSFPQLLG